MNVLVLDSAGGRLSIALHSGDEITCRWGTDETPYSMQALPLVLNLLAGKKLTPDKCDAFAFAAGPGKFSALRLVCSVAKTLAYAHKKPLISVPSFAALARANAEAGAGAGTRMKKIKCAMPAHRGHIFFSVCEKTETENGAMWRSINPRVVAATATAPQKGVPHACGEGFAAYPELLGGAKFHEFALYPDAESAAHIAAQMYAQKQFVSPLDAAPLYVRKDVAKTIVERENEKKDAAKEAAKQAKKEAKKTAPPEANKDIPPEGIQKEADISPAQNENEEEQEAAVKMA